MIKCVSYTMIVICSIVILWIISYYNAYKMVSYQIFIKFNSKKELYLEDGCKPVNGENEWLQINRYWDFYLHHKNTVLPISRQEADSSFKYKIHGFNAEHTSNLPETFTLVIEETFEGLPTIGGSSFRVELHEYSLGDLHLRLCHVMDDFSGNYSVCCFHQYPCLKIDIFVMYTNFNAYVDTVTDDPLIKHIWRGKRCKHDRVRANLSYCDKPIKMNARGHWVYRSNEWIWTDEHGCMVKMLKQEEIGHCLLQLRSLHFIGSSHMRFNYDYTATFLPVESRPNKYVRYHKSCSQLNVYYHVQRYMIDIPWTFMATINSMENMTKDDILVLQSGAWDIGSRGVNLARYMNNTLPEAVEKLYHMKQGYFEARMIWFSPLAFPQNRTGDKRRVKLNNFVIGAFNYWLMPRVENMGFEVMDVFEMTLPRNEHSVDRIHYIDADKSDPNVGITFMHVFLSNICHGTFN